MNIFLHFRDLIYQQVQNKYRGMFALEDIKVEYPRNSQYGDICSNVALIISEKTQKNPKMIANTLQRDLQYHDDIEEVSVEGVGFLNIKVRLKFWHNFLREVLILGDTYPEINIGNGEKVNIEFVSANPTGPLHLGHAKGAIFGDSISNLLFKCGYNVTKEFYINDGGNQIENLTRSLEIHYQRLFNKDVELDQDCYQGQYIIDLAKELKNKHEDQIKSFRDNEAKAFLEEFAVSNIIQTIKNNLVKLGVFHDFFTSEKRIMEQGKIEECLKLLKEKGLLYSGLIKKPKGQYCNKLHQKEQVIFKSTLFGDDIDRVLIKPNGAYTYFASDIAYHLDKVSRGFNNMILLLGTDHIGYKKRITSAVSALSEGKAKLDVKFCQLVKLLRNGELVKMSKRSGNFIELTDVIDEIGRDALKFGILSKSSDTLIEIDLEKLKKQNKDNPIFYVQYAYARTESIIRRAKDIGVNIHYTLSHDHIDLSLLDSTYDISLIKILALYPKILLSCLSTLDPHKITYYLYDLSCKFHQTWSKGMKKEDIRFLIKNNIPLTHARVLLAYSVGLVIKSGLKILGIEAIKEM